LSADVIRPAVATVTDAPAPLHLCLALEKLFATVCASVLKLQTAPGDGVLVREIGFVIGRVLDLIEDDARILDAADHLYEAASALQETRDKRSRSPRITEQVIESRTEALHPALARFRESLYAAKPNARGRARRLKK